MMIYGYRCRNCGHTEESTFRGFTLGSCRKCVPGYLNRDYSGISLHRPVMPHFNTTLGREVTGMRDFTEGLHRAGEEFTERTGIVSNFKPIMPGDVAVTSEGLDTTNRERHAQGLRPVEVP